MRRIFADTSFYQAILNEDDAWHNAAARIRAMWEAAPSQRSTFS